MGSMRHTGIGGFRAAGDRVRHALELGAGVRWGFTPWACPARRPESKHQVMPALLRGLRRQERAAGLPGRQACLGCDLNFMFLC